MYPARSRKRIIQYAEIQREREREEGTETRLPRMPETSNGDKFLGKIFWTPKLYRFLAPTERRGRRGIRGMGRSCTGSRYRTFISGQDGEADLERQPRLSYVDFIPHYSTRHSRDTEPLLGRISFIFSLPSSDCDVARVANVVA